MARFIVATALLLATAPFSSLEARAEQQPTEAIRELATEANVDPLELQGAVNELGLTSHQEIVDYLTFMGLLRPPPSPTPAPPPEAPPGIFDALAMCESHGDWSVVSSGGTYRGGIQIDQTAWKNHGGLEFAPSAHLASRSEQIIVGWRIQADQGWGAWPYCSRKLGLR